MRILIADDHPIFRGGLRRVLEDYGHQVVAECDDGRSVSECALASEPDIILMDLQMPGQGGIATVRQLQGVPPTVMLTVSEDREDMRDAMDAGASGYLLKSTEPAELNRVLESVAEGYRIFPKRLQRGGDGAPALSVRQRDVLDGLIRGLTLKQIGLDLGISQFTVRTYQERLLEKFGVGSRAELIFRASRDARQLGPILTSSEK